MNYAILKYRIIYNDKQTKEGFTPFRGNDMSQETMIKFVEGYFVGQRDIENIQVEIHKQFDNPQTWLSEVRFSEEFQYLQRVNNFAGDLTNI